MVKSFNDYGPRPTNERMALAALADHGKITLETATGLFFETNLDVQSVNGRIIQALQVLGRINAIDIVTTPNDLSFHHLRFIVQKGEAP